jgi:REP element-mobilizing transposase RayT
MGRPLRIVAPGGLVHVTMRGVDRQDIFLDGWDRLLFLRLLGRSRKLYEWLVLAYCLMGNHFHLVLQTPEPTLSDGMRDLAGIYARRFNARRNRKGHLYEARFGAEPIGTEAHLLETLRYVVLNPVRAGFVRHPSEWEWSSYLATFGELDAPAFLDRDNVLSLFGADARAGLRYEQFVLDRLAWSRARADERRHVAA